MKTQILLRYLGIALLLGIFFPLKSKAYSVLAHEAIVDASWEKSIVPLLKQRFPGTSDSAILLAHAYAYGGCLVADMGYFPFGSKYFTNLIHYVRSGDFVDTLISEARDVNEYAFALGALSHYIADKYGHSLATNLTVPLVYPKIRKKFGDVVTYEDDHISHTRTEFAFDVLQTARGNYQTHSYHDFIGFEVSKPVLERAFLKTYGIDINTIFKNIDLTISTFRWSVKNLIPTLTRTAWVIKKQDIKKTNPSATSRNFTYKIEKREYYLEYGKQREKPGFKAQVLSFIIRILPKVGPLRVLRFKNPGPEGEKLFIISFDTSLFYYSAYLGKLDYRTINLPDIDYDTGKKTEPGEYGLADATYDQLLINLQIDSFRYLSAALKRNILSFYSNADTAAFYNRNPVEWQKASFALQQVKTATPVPIDSLNTSPALIKSQTGGGNMQK